MGDRARELHHPEVAEIEVSTVLQALADPIRLRIVRTLHEAGEMACGAIELPVGNSTRTHHFRVLREAGVTRSHYQGTSIMTRLRREDIDPLFPGLLDGVLAGCAASPLVG